MILYFVYLTKDTACNCDMTIFDCFPCFVLAPQWHRQAWTDINHHDGLVGLTSASAGGIIDKVIQSMGPRNTRARALTRNRVELSVGILQSAGRVVCGSLWCQIYRFWIAYHSALLKPSGITCTGISLLRYRIIHR